MAKVWLALCASIIAGGLIVSLASGLSLTASTGNNGGGSSSMSVGYGATVDDYAHQHVQLIPNDGTLSNAFSGSGDLLFGTISNADTNGNYVSVTRSISGRPISTTWTYDWGTYPTYASGVGAWLSLTANNAYSIYGSGYASNNEGDVASEYTSAGSSRATTSIKNYYIAATALPSISACIQQSADSITSTGPIIIQGTCYNREKDSTEGLISIPSGTITNPTMQVYSSQISARTSMDKPQPTVSAISTSGTGRLYAYASNSEVDSSKFNLQVSNGKVTNPQFYAWSQKFFAETWASIPQAYGSVDLSSHAQNARPATEYIYSGAKQYIPTTYYGGADFEVKTASLASTTLQSTATTSNVLITPTLPTSIKTAIILEPMNTAFTKYSWETTSKGVKYTGATDLGKTVFPDLVAKGYATLRYTDSGASSDKFKNLGQNNVVLIQSHMDPGNVVLSTINPNTNSYNLPASQLNYQTSKNSLVILAGCQSFKGYSTTKSALATAVSGAYLSAGYAGDVYDLWRADYVSYFFDALKAGKSASYADTYANKLALAKWGKGSETLPLVFYPINWQHNFYL